MNSTKFLLGSLYDLRSLYSTEYWLVCLEVSGIGINSKVLSLNKGLLNLWDVLAPTFARKILDPILASPNRPWHMGVGIQASRPRHLSSTLALA